MDNGHVGGAGIAEEALLYHGIVGDLGVILERQFYRGGVFEAGNKAVGTGLKRFLRPGLGGGSGLDARSGGLLLRLAQQRGNAGGQRTHSGQAQRRDHFPFFHGIAFFRQSVGILLPVL